MSEAMGPAPPIDLDAATDRQPLATRATRVSALEVAVLVGLLVLAAAVRLPGLAARGQWDADQGTDMLVLRSLVEDGDVPLLGPRTSIGSFHHGAVYYWLLAPAAVLSDADPVAVTLELALLGLGAVAATWWLARLVGGPVAAVAAGVLMAVSPAAIDESTFIWNPNPIPLFAALAFAGAIVARRTGRARWWLLAGLGAMVTIQLHILGAVILVPLVWAWAADVVARRRAGDAEGMRGALRGGLGALVIVGAGYLPLLASEAAHDFAELLAILAYLGGGGREAAGGSLARIVTVGLRAITWPFAGVLTDRIAASLVVALIVLGLFGVAVARRRVVDGVTNAGAARWLLGAFAACVVLLALFAPSLATITPGLPNDHYHNLLDPIVIALAGVGIAKIWAGTPAVGPVPARAVAGGLTAVLLVIGVTAWPPAVSPDGGWPMADRAAARVRAVTGDATTGLDGIPAFKNDNALRFPLERGGANLLEPGTVDGGERWVVVCDPLFAQVVGATCGGPAEDAWLASTTGLPALSLVDRFGAGPRRVVSVYARQITPG
jgi:4-amino-4-deoxy-L-arabinose transferase-like glycosyltransferase